MMTNFLLLLLSLPIASPSDPVAEVCATFTAFDQDGDGAPEIDAVEPLFSAGAEGPRLLVLIEDRLAEAKEGDLDLTPRLERWIADLAAEGYRANALSVHLTQSDRHQDGRSLLALRELLRAFARESDLAGAILFGHFPDAFLVRTVNWRRKGNITLHQGQKSQASYQGVPYLRRVPEDVAHRADIVLSDLDGRWEDVYVQPRTRLETITAVYPDGIAKRGGPCTDLARGSVVNEDFFLITDGKLEIRETLDAEGAVVGQALFLDDTSAGHECSIEDRARPNPISRPDILVSRLDARGTALRPRPDLVGSSGEGLLDENGQPQAVTFASQKAVPSWRGDEVWEQDPALERQLLAEYLDRNHSYRIGAAAIAWRPSSIACDLGSGFREMSRAAADWQERDAPLSDIHGRPTLEQFADWLAFPAVLRTLRAHSDAVGSVFGGSKSSTLAQRLGGPAWSWTHRKNRLEPSLDAACSRGRLDWFLLHTLWRNGAVAPEPAFYHHTGCHSISPPNATKLAYDHPAYGRRQGAEALLLFGSGLALVGRSKVFYDEPKGFATALARGETFGAAWASYFDIESRAESWSQAGGDIGRKRAYFWSVLGDWTLRLRKPTAER